jgi:hypothetical protein
MMGSSGAYATFPAAAVTAQLAVLHIMRVSLILLTLGYFVIFYVLRYM